MLQGMRHLQRYGHLLALLLLLGQTMSLLHAHDPGQHLDNSHCHICLHSTAHDHALAVAAMVVPVVAMVGTLRSELIQRPSHSIFSPNYQSRAPPHFT